MTKTNLYNLCGLDLPGKKLPKHKWISAKLKFLGAERYVLGTKTVEVALSHKPAGIGLLFRKSLTIDAAVLLGTQRKPGVLVDVEVSPLPIDPLERW